MKNIVYILVFIGLNVFSQSKYLTKTGIVAFEASVLSFEEVASINNSTTAIYNKETGEFAALVFVKGFRFKNALMEEHFNENYAESDKYPKATFKGNIIVTSDKHQIIGELSFHGKIKKTEAIPITFTEESGIINISGTFKVNASDFDIKIPKIVKDKVSETIDISFNFNMNKK